MDTCIQINDKDYLSSLHDDYKQSWKLEEAAKSLNLKAFHISALIKNEFKLFTLIMGAFGITEIYEFLSSEDFEKNLALIYAAANSNVDSISKLVELGANIEAKDDNGRTALIVASLFNRVNSFSKLVELGANQYEFEEATIL